MRSFEQDMERAVAYHGHLCSGQCVGVKMAHCGMKQLGLDNETDGKKLMVFLECDRCPADSISIATGCRIGKRTIKCMDYGKVAASFVDLSTGRAVRVSRTKRMHPAEGEDMIAFYRDLPEEAIFRVQEVQIDLKPGDLPGPPCETLFCSACGEDVTDARHVMRDGKPLCRACADGGYYRTK